MGERVHLAIMLPEEISKENYVFENKTEGEQVSI